MKWGILGASKFAFEFMGPAIHAASGAQLLGVATRSTGNAGKFQKFAPEVVEYSNYDDLIGSAEIDAVYIPLPHTLHAEWTVKALNAGKHVLCEKPIAMHVSDFDGMISARDTSGKFATEAYMIAHHPQWVRARHIIDDGGIGRIVHINGAFSYDNSSDPENIRNSAATGGGGLRDIGVYTIGSAYLVMGDTLKDVTARVRWENGFDTFAEVQGTIGGATYTSYVSTRMQPFQEMTFHGTAGVMRLTAPFNPRAYGEARIEIHQPGLGLRVERFPTADQYKSQVEAFVKTAETGAAYPWTLENARETQVVLDAIFDVAQTID